MARVNLVNLVKLVNLVSLVNVESLVNLVIVFLIINQYIFEVWNSTSYFCKVGGLDVETNRDRDRERP